MLSKLGIFVFIILATLTVFIFLDDEDIIATEVVAGPCEFDLKIRHMGLGEATLKLEIAHEPEERVCGLSYREEMAEDEGMVIVYDDEDYYSIWMKDMNFSLDLVWMNTAWEVVDITRDVTPESFPEIFTSKIPAQYAIELNSGSVDAFNILIGDSVYLPR